MLLRAALHAQGPGTRSAARALQAQTSTAQTSLASATSHWSPVNAFYLKTGASASGDFTPWAV